MSRPPPGACTISTCGARSSSAQAAAAVLSAPGTVSPAPWRSARGLLEEHRRRARVDLHLGGDAPERLRRGGAQPRLEPADRTDEPQLRRLPRPREQAPARRRERELGAPRVAARGPPAQV